jgi:hypothetical protein
MTMALMKMACSRGRALWAAVSASPRQFPLVWIRPGLLCSWEPVVQLHHWCNCAWRARHAHAWTPAGRCHAHDARPEHSLHPGAPSRRQARRRLVHEHSTGAHGDGERRPGSQVDGVLSLAIGLAVSITLRLPPPVCV